MTKDLQSGNFLLWVIIHYSFLKKVRITSSVIFTILGASFLSSPCLNFAKGEGAGVKRSSQPNIKCG